MALLLCLGTWQVRRLAWKEALLAEIEQQITAPVMDVPVAADVPRYRRVRAAGVFLHEHEIRLTPRVRDGIAGFHVVTPLKRDADVILVDRGFATMDTVADFPRPAGVQTVTGSATQPERGAFTPVNDPAKGFWYFLDPAEIAAATGIDGMRRFVIVEGGERPKIRNNHFKYALFWFFMAAAMICVYLVYTYRGRGSDEVHKHTR